MQTEVIGRMRRGEEQDMEADLIYDVGMNNGDDTAYYLHRGFRVVAIEADPTLVETAAARFREAIAAKRLTILNIAVADKDGALPFWICDNHSEWNSFDRSIASRRGHPHHAIEVEARRFEGVLAEYGVPYFLKIDIEGHDHLCLEALCAQPADLPRYVSFERGDEVLARLPLLRDLGYDGFKGLSQWHFLPLQTEPTPELRQAERIQRARGFFKSGLLGKAVGRAGGARLVNRRLRQLRRQGDWKFPVGASGPFGEDTAGRWQRYDEFQGTLRTIDERRQQGGASAYWAQGSYYWVDIHARRS